MEWMHDLHLRIVTRQFNLPINQSDDPRIGSGRDNSTGGTLSHALGGSDEDSDSLSSLGSTFIPIAVYSAVCLIIFFTFRRNCVRAYAPKTLPQLRSPDNPSPELPNGWFNWIKPFFAIDNEYILNNCSLDGYLFLRFLRILAIICLVGVCLAWPVLLAVNGTGGSGLRELNMFTIGNVKSKGKYFAHAFVAWVFFGFVLYMICRECIYYINLRQAYLLSPNYSKRLSSRTVLFTSIPEPYLEEAKLRKIFGDSAKNIWIPKNTNVLRGMVEDREDLAARLEQAEIQLIKKANRARSNQLKQRPATPDSDSSASKRPSTVSRRESAQDDAEQGKADPDIQCSEHQVSPSESTTTEEKDPEIEYTHPYGLHPSLPDVRGSVAALWIPASDRPYHRPLINFGRRVDTIRWSRARMKVLNRDIWKIRKKYRNGDGVPLNSAFIEFDSQASAQAAFQILAHHQPMNMSPRYIGLRPEDIVWSALRIKWWEGIMRRFAMMAFIAVAVLFWSIPSAIVGMVSNIESLSNLTILLSWVRLLPSVIKGLLQGLLPAFALSWLMAIVPGILRACARVAGVPSNALVELYVQNGYFIFQLVQVFLVTTLTSAAAAAFEKLVKDPLSATDLLSENLPKASNFYLSYILVQCLAVGATNLANFGDLFRHEVAGRLAQDPRKQYKRWSKLTTIHWGGVYPRFTNMGVIALSYSCIAPLILVFAGLGLLFVEQVYRYGIIYIWDDNLDTKGLLYPRALMQLLMGLYVAEICLVGLFALAKAFGPLAMMVMFLVFTILVHISLSDAVQPLLSNLPQTLALEKEIGPIAEDGESTGENEGPRPERQDGGGLAADYYNTDEHFGDEPEPPPVDELDSDVQMRGIEGSSSLKYTVLEWFKTFTRARLAALKKETPGDNTQTPGNDTAGPGGGQHHGPWPAATPGQSTTTMLMNASNESGFTLVLTQIKNWITPDPNRKPNFLLRWLHPEIYQDFRSLQRKVNPGPKDVELPEDYTRKAYQPPEMWQPAPGLWIPRDDAWVSRQEVAHNREVVSVVTDEGIWLTEKGKVKFEVEKAPYVEPRVLY